MISCRNMQPHSALRATNLGHSQCVQAALREYLRTPAPLTGSFHEDLFSPVVDCFPAFAEANKLYAVVDRGATAHAAGVESLLGSDLSWLRQANGGGTACSCNGRR